MSKPFEAAIETLRFMGPKYSEDYSSAIRVLEAAGAVDKNKCLIEFAGDYDVMRMSVQTYEQIYDYLDALPDKGE